MKVIIGADLVPTENNYSEFINGEITALADEKILQALREADFNVFNLECALADKSTPIRKAGPNLKAPTATINGIKALGASLLGICNNHILDHGREGLASTLKTLDNAGLPHVGAGFSKDEAKKPYYFEKDGIRLGVFACCEHEFSWVEDYGFGTNGFDPLESPDDIAEAKKHCDYLIVLYHGGKEHYRYPSPQLKKTCRKIIDKGADIVLCQHTHCVGTEEDYNGGKIIFGQGNFIFAEEYEIEPSWGEGVLVRINLEKGKAPRYDYIPYDKTGKGIAYDESGEIIEGLNKRSEEIKRDGFIEREFEKMAEETVVRRYVWQMLGHEPSEEELNDLLIPLFHFAECEVHRECLITGLRKKGKLGRFGEFKK